MPTRDGKRLMEILSNLIQIILELTEPTDSTDEINKLREERDNLREASVKLQLKINALESGNERLKQDLLKQIIVK